MNRLAVTNAQNSNNRTTSFLNFIPQLFYSIAEITTISASFYLLLVHSILSLIKNMQNRTLQTQEQELKRLIRMIQDERCILILGPDCSVNEQGVRLFPTFIQQFEDYNQPLHFDMDDMINFRGDGVLKNDFLLDMKDFYEQHAVPGSFHKKIACIPFHLIISGTPDKLVENAFKHYHLPYRKDFYHAKSNPLALDEPTKNVPLIYSLFGSIEEEDSVVLTYEDLFDFIFAIAGGGEGAQPLPTYLKYAINNARSFLFLGFDLRKWYVQLLFRLLDLHNRNRTPITYDTWDEPTKNFYVNNFQIKFLPADMYVLIDALYEETEKNGALRKSISANTEEFAFAEVKKLIAANQITLAFQQLIAYAKEKDSELHNSLVLLSARFHRNEQSFERGTVSQTDYQLELNLVNYALLNTIDNML